ncbi:lipopolysaccharide 1,6-galactosyltransferase [Affinibrenneria salicis]|uniref:Lipopolysaccharide 1,6-galactosyltransferase n=1 Tax=Affinibrenneria salicis TaxID=2590031 RepID=A0A5J5FUS3_9GAMM|nr:lipopolysaccharide 1,6-galactosyltransferase [Affinibrenneria salicis]KAA8997302.1 lipopolysaccharide 1,6-galactosyltransferase [Affinibrenneria salicis]
MNILFVGEAVSGFGGIETVIKKVTGFLADDRVTPNDYMLYFFCRDDRMDKSWLSGKNAIRHYSRIRLSFLRRLSHICALSRYIRQNRPDVIIAFDSPSCHMAARAIHASKQKIPLISWVHYSLDHKKHSQQVLAADYHLAISSGIRQQLIARGVEPDRIAVVFNPVTPGDRVIPRPDDKHGASFIYVGRIKFEGQKRLKDLLDTLAMLKGNWTMHMVGDGSDLAQCRQYAEQLGIDERIRWHGWQAKPWEYVQNEIKAVTALLLTSSFEGFGMVLVEAMSYGVYCISSDCPSGPADIIRSGINGELYPPGDTSALSAILQSIVEHKVLPAAGDIQASIAAFYDDAYYQEIKKIIQSRGQG